MNRASLIPLFMLLFPLFSINATDSAVALAHLQRGDHAAAYREFRGLAERGYPGYQNIVAGMHEEGRGVPRDRVLAHVWYSLSAAQGDREGIAERARLEKELTSDELTRSRQLAPGYANQYLAPYRKSGDWRL